MGGLKGGLDGGGGEGGGIPGGSGGNGGGGEGGGGGANTLVWIDTALPRLAPTASFSKALSSAGEPDSALEPPVGITAYNREGRGGEGGAPSTTPHAHTPDREQVQIIARGHSAVCSRAEQGRQAGSTRDLHSGSKAGKLLYNVGGAVLLRNPLSHRVGGQEAPAGG